MSKVGDNIRKYRKEAGMTQQELAVAAGMSLSALVKIEAGDTRLPNEDNRQKLAAALGIKLADLFREE